MNQQTERSRFKTILFVGILAVIFLVGAGCVTTTEIDEGYGVTVTEEPPLEDQVKVEN